MKPIQGSLALPIALTADVARYAIVITPVERVGDVWLKRDDLFERAGVRGGKVRTCWHLARGATGLITAGSRQSPQVNIVAHIARELDVPCRVHVPDGPITPELEDAALCGAQLVRHRPGYNSVIVARANRDARDLNWTLIPFGMECTEAVRQTEAQVDNIPADARRLVVCVGSGMSLAGILHGLERTGRTLPVLGVVVGADPTKRLNRYAPIAWADRVELAPSIYDYHDAAVEWSKWYDVRLDPIYEAKCVPFLRPDDVFWCVGIRATATGETTR